MSLAGLSAFCALSAVSCNPIDRLTGAFADKPGGDPIVKLERQGGKYTLMARERTNWVPVAEMREATEQELRALFRSDFDALRPFGLCGLNGGFPVLVRVQPNVRGREIRTTTDTFLALNLLISGSVYRT